VNTDAAPAEAAVRDFQATFAEVRAEIGRVVVGHEQPIEEILTAFFAGGHVLIEGVPGIGKTLIVRALADALALGFARIQFTVDLMPADVTGTRVITEGTDGRREFVFVPGPLFTHVLLADEINRATPKTQSALLEAMAERQVTVAGTTHALAAPFFVLATLNPIEMEGTYQLPEAQLDRFLLKVLLEPPSQEALERILGRTTAADVPSVRPVLDPATAPARVEELRRLVRRVLVAPHVERHAAAIVRLTAPAAAADDVVRRYVAYGASPRGGQALLLGAKVRALLDGRGHVAREDVDHVAPAALRHRLVMNFAADADGVTAVDVVARVLATARRLPP
jgi:MoxR-like ATPase